MRIRDIAILDIERGAIWKVVDFGNENTDWLDWGIEKAAKVMKNDIIVHSGVVVEKEIKVYPAIMTKYYEDGGEVGEIALSFNGQWIHYGPEIHFEHEVSGPYLSHISILDHHEYQLGRFDNRNQHKLKFNHYMKQLHSNTVTPFKENETRLPKRITKLSVDDQIQYVKNSILQAREYTEQCLVSKNNRLVTEYRLVLQVIKSHPENHPLLKKLLYDEDPRIVQSMKYLLIDIYQEECIELLRKAAQERSVDGIAAKIWLSDLGVKEI